MTTKQNKDFLNGDHSFKNWLKIMWKSKAILIFIIGVIVTVGMFANANEILSYMDKDDIVGVIFTVFGFLIGPMIVLIVAYKSFYQHWDDLKNGRSR